MPLNGSHKATGHIIPIDITPPGMGKLSTNKHAGLMLKANNAQTMPFLSAPPPQFCTCAYLLILRLQINLLVRGRAEWHRSGCVRADQWRFSIHSGMKLQTQENEAVFVATLNPWLKSNASRGE